MTGGLKAAACFYSFVTSPGTPVPATIPFDAPGVAYGTGIARSSAPPGNLTNFDLAYPGYYYVQFQIPVSAACSVQLAVNGVAMAPSLAQTYTIDGTTLTGFGFLQVTGPGDNTVSVIQSLPTSPPAALLPGYCQLTIVKYL